MLGLHFSTTRPVEPRSPARADIPLFVGFVRRARQRDGELRAVPEAVASWLEAGHWPHDATLRQVPVPINSPGEFEAIFESRRDGGRSGEIAYLAAAVASFFEQGGATCYVLRVDDPWSYHARRDDQVRRLWLDVLMPSRRRSPQASDRSSWTDVGSLLGLPDVAFVAFPDLPDLVAIDPQLLQVVAFPAAPEVFVECVDGDDASPDALRVARSSVPVTDDAGFAVWAEAVSHIVRFVRAHRRDVHVVAAAPVPAADSRVDASLLDGLTALGLTTGVEAGGVSSAFLQLSWPWLHTTGASRLPGGFEPPDGVLCGLLARGARTLGSHRSVAHLTPDRVSRLYPPLSRDQRERPQAFATSRRPRALQETLCVFGERVGARVLLSDVTTSGDESHRPGAVSRIVAALIRMAHHTGQGLVFEPNGEATWGRVRTVFSGLLERFWREGALAGSSASEAFAVRCDGSTHSQADLDGGRVRCEIVVQPAAPVESIEVVLTVANGGIVEVSR